MPSVSMKQHRLMQAVKHSSEFAKKVGIPQSVGADFMAADKSEGKYQHQKRTAKHIRGMK